MDADAAVDSVATAAYGSSYFSAAVAADSAVDAAATAVATTADVDAANEQTKAELRTPLCYLLIILKARAGGDTPPSLAFLLLI